MTDCRFCRAPLTRTFVDLGRAPLSNAFLSAEQLRLAEAHYPLHAYVCDNCLLVQLEEFASPETIFGDYLYFSSYSDAWLRHAEAYAARMIEQLGLDARSLVVEVASNDGYLLQYFRQSGIDVLGVEPAANIAEVARAKGIATEVAFFGVATARLMRAFGMKIHAINRRGASDEPTDWITKADRIDEMGPLLSQCLELPPEAELQPGMRASIQVRGL